MLLRPKPALLAKTSAPMRSVRGLALQRQGDHVLHRGIADLPRRTGPRFIQKTIHAALDEAPPPTSDRLTQHAKPFCDPVGTSGGQSDRAEAGLR
jgi:hypothetical protein